jgi:hypothetical protein
MIYKQTVTERNGSTYIMYRQENADGSMVFYTEEAPFIIQWLAEGNTAEEWSPEA